MRNRTFAHTMRAALAALAASAAFVAPGSAGAAARGGWKAQVEQAGGVWAGEPGAASWEGKVLRPASARGALPRAVQRMLDADVQENPWTRGHEEMNGKLGPFAPEAGRAFDLPYIPIPEGEMKFGYVAEGIPPALRDHVRFRGPDGKATIRFFFHPLNADKYASLIETYGVRYGEYSAAATSSPRSLVVWENGHESRPFWVKVSLHATIDTYTVRRGGQTREVGISRVQTEKKARRSALVDHLVASIPRAELSRHGIELMSEPASFVPGDIRWRGKRQGFDRAVIFRELPSSLVASGGSEYLPAFSFIGRMGELGANVDRERARAGQGPLSAQEFAERYLMEPLVRTFLYLGVEHGLQGELHTQNFLLEVDGRGLPTGRLMVKDLDGFRVDVDFRIRNGKPIEFLRGYETPFEWAKHSATQGRPGQPAVLHAWFNRLIRNVNGFNSVRGGKVVHATPAGQLLDWFAQHHPEARVTQDSIQAHFDRVAQRVFREVTGVEIPMESWRYQRGQGIDGGVQALRAELRQAQVGLDDPKVQGELGQAWTRLRREHRAYLQSGATDLVFHYLGDGVIEARARRTGAHAGYALLRPAETAPFETSLRARGARVPRLARAAHARTRGYHQAGNPALGGRAAVARAQARPHQQPAPRARVTRPVRPQAARTARAARTRGR